MTHTPTALPHSLGHYKDDEYFAFVESIDALDILAHDRRQALPAEWDPLLIDRWVQGYGLPTRALWLNCVRAPYFDSLSWRREACDFTDAAQAAKWRRRLSEIEARQVVNVLLLVDENGERERHACAQLSENPWHRIFLGREAGLQALVCCSRSATSEMRRVEYRQPCSTEERSSLDAVFSAAALRRTKSSQGSRGLGLSEPRAAYGRVVELRSRIAAL